MPGLHDIIEGSEETDEIQRHFVDHLQLTPLEHPRLVRYLLAGYISQLYEHNAEDIDYALVRDGLFKMSPLYQILERNGFRKALCDLGYPIDDINLLKRDVQLSRVYLERKTGLVTRAGNQNRYNGILPFYFVLPRSDHEMAKIIEWYDATAVKARVAGIRRYRE